MSKPNGKTTPCPCCSGRSYAACCQPLHEGAAALTAVSLMRSRYCAYALGLESYLRRTWAAGYCPEDTLLEPAVKWIGLDVLRHEAGELTDQQGTVSFVARYKVGGRACRMTETSRFIREQNEWRYLDGEVGE